MLEPTPKSRYGGVLPYLLILKATFFAKMDLSE